MPEISTSPKIVPVKPIRSVDTLQEIHRAKLQKTRKSIELLQDQLRGVTRRVRFSSEGSNETVSDQDNSKSDAECNDAKVEHSTCEDVKDGNDAKVESQEQVQCFIVRMHHNAVDEDAPITKTTTLERNKMIIANNKLIIDNEENVNKSDEGYETPDESVTETNPKNDIKTHERKQSLQTVDQCFDFLKSEDDDGEVKSTEADDEASSTTSIDEESTETESKLLNEKTDDDEAIQVDAEEEVSKMNHVSADELKVYDEALKKGMKHRRGSTLSWMAQKFTQKSSSKSGNRNKRPKFGPLFSFGLSSHVAP